MADRYDLIVCSNVLEHVPYRLICFRHKAGDAT